MNALFTRLGRSEKTMDRYSSYKYSDIQPQWILHQGDLEYLSGETILKSPSFKQVLSVLTCFVNEKKEHSVSLYLYTEKSKSPFKYFQLDKNDQLNDRCRRLIEGKAGLFFLELIIDQTNKGEIFGTKSVPERRLWIEKFDQAISKLKPKLITRSVSDVHSSRLRDSSAACSVPVRANPVNHPSFLNDDTDDYLQPTQSMFGGWTSNPTGYLGLPSDLPVHDYEEVKPMLISWPNIFYDNQNRDFANVLSKTNETGIFLVRPQSKTTASNAHDYTLCVYDNHHVYKFEIHQSSVNHPNQYQLTFRDNEPAFVHIVELCQYYTTHPLRITSTNGLNKPLYLTLPYKH